MADTTVKLSGTYDSIEAYNILEEMREMSSDYDEIRTEAAAAASAATAAVATANTAVSTAQTAATNAGTYADNANTSASNAASSASTASTQAGNAADSATAAAASATAAATSETNAAASQTAAASSATAAAGSETAAAASAESAATAATAAATTVVTNILVNNAGAHNAIFRGKYLGNALTAAQSAAIQAGTFDDMYIGDYWTINGINWRIAGFDYWYNVGVTNFTTHHVVIVPDTTLYNAQYNTSSTTEGGYVGSALYAGIGTARTTVKNAFGAAHVPTHKVLLPTTCTGGKYTGWAWREEDIMLMNEVMVYGARAWGAPANNGYSVASQDRQLPLFALNPSSIHTRQSYWLQDVASASWFASVGANGLAYNNNASASIGVRPAFALI